MWISILTAALCQCLSRYTRKRQGKEENAVRKKVIAKKNETISEGTDIPVFNVATIIKNFKACGTVANIPGHGCKRKNDPSLKRKIVQMVGKEPRKTSRQS